MLTGKKLPLVKENIKMKKALKIINDKKLGVLIIQKNNGDTSGIITDGDLKRIAQKFNKFDDLEIKKVMTKRPFSVDEDTLAASALSIMNTKKLPLFVFIKKEKQKNYWYNSHA